MSDTRSKKEKLRAFRAEPETGGVYAIRNTANGRSLILSTTTISKASGSLEFSKATGSCVHPLLAADWKSFGPGAYTLEILETLERKDSETDAEFAGEVRALADLWRERIPPEGLY